MEKQACAPLDVAGKRVLVLGIARSGLAAARLLQSLGAVPLAYDAQSPQDRPQAAEQLAQWGIRYYSGEEIGELLGQAQLAVTSPGIALDSPLIEQVTQQGVQLIGELELAWQALHGRVLAVSGTNGKTTTVSLIGDILAKAGRVAQVAGNIGRPLSDAVLNQGREDEFAVEVSSFQLETVCSFRPTIAAMLNITPDHLNRHGSLEEYIRIKQRLFAYQTPADWAVLNWDDPHCRAMAEGVKSQVVWFSRLEVPPQGACVQNGMIVMRLGKEENAVCSVAELRLPGAHNLENALAATAVCFLAGVPAAVIRFSLKTFAGVEHRIEFVREVNSVRYINDSKGTNPDSSIKAVEAMISSTVLIAGGSDKHTPFDAFARAIQQSGQICHVLLIGQTAKQIARQLQEIGYTAVDFADSLEQAVRQAQTLAPAGGNVLLSPACASFDMFTDYEARGRVFKQAVQALHDAAEGV